jgi:hypothetical protein
MAKSRSEVRVGRTIGGERSEEQAVQVGRMAAQERGASERHRVRARWEKAERCPDENRRQRESKVVVHVTPRVCPEGIPGVGRPVCSTIVDKYMSSKCLSQVHVKSGDS